MSTMNFNVPGTGAADVPVPQGRAQDRELHRLKAVRLAQGVSRRTVAKRLGVELNEVAEMEDERTDLKLSTLMKWQEILDVPVAELLVDSESTLSPPVLKRARMLRLMKTVMAIFERTNQPSIRRMAQMMVEQLVEIMPELKGVSPWHAVGERRTLNDLGQTADRVLPASLFNDTAD